MKKIPDRVLKEMWEYILTTSAFEKMIEKHEKEKAVAK